MHRPQLFCHNQRSKFYVKIPCLAENLLRKLNIVFCRLLAILEFIIMLEKNTCFIFNIIIHNNFHLICNTY